MENTELRFLEALNCAIHGTPLHWQNQITGAELVHILELAQEHHVLPMIFDLIYTCPAAAQIDPSLLMLYRHTTIQSVMAQAVKTEEFLELNRHLHARGIRPLVVKGLICRSLYPQPDCRYSGDEDVLCGEDAFPECHKALLEAGLEPCASQLDSYEVPYRREDGALYIELHKTLFNQASDVFSDCNRFFADAFSRCTSITLQGQEIFTLCPTDHMLYLIVHAFKHFLHSGFGIRQVCDMMLFANRYGSQIQWDYVLEQCRSIRCHRFADALFSIGKAHLGFDAALACYPEPEEAVDGTALLEDLLAGGIYGSSDRSRVHSSNMTLNAVEADKKGKKAKRRILRTVFPSAKSIEGRFPYLKRMPVLLPVAWTCRLFGYAKESITDPDSAASDVIRTGTQRIELLRQYHIID